MDQKKQAAGIFREKSIKRVSSPEELNDYICVTTPSVWIVLLALVVLLLGMLAWSVFGRVAIHNDDGTVQEIAPITYVTN